MKGGREFGFRMEAETAGMSVKVSVKGPGGVGWAGGEGLAFSGACCVLYKAETRDAWVNWPFSKDFSSVSRSVMSSLPWLRRNECTT